MIIVSSCGRSPARRHMIGWRVDYIGNCPAPQCSGRRLAALTNEWRRNVNARQRRRQCSYRCVAIRGHLEFRRGLFDCGGRGGLIRRLDPAGGRTAAMAALNCAWAQAQGNAEIGRCISLPIAVPLPLRRPAPDAALTAFADSPEASPAPASRRDKLDQAPATAPST